MNEADNIAQNIAQYVLTELDGIFARVADNIGTGIFDTSSLTNAQKAGIPSIIFAANMYMRRCWQEYTGMNSEDDDD